MFVHFHLCHLQQISANADGDPVGADSTAQSSSLQDEPSQGDAKKEPVKAEEEVEEEEDDWGLSMHDFLSAMSTEPELIAFLERRLPLPTMTFRVGGGMSRR